GLGLTLTYSPPPPPPHPHPPRPRPRPHRPCHPLLLVVHPWWTRRLPEGFMRETESVWMEWVEMDWKEWRGRWMVFFDGDLEVIFGLCGLCMFPSSFSFFLVIIIAV